MEGRTPSRSCLATERANEIRLRWGGEVKQLDTQEQQQDRESVQSKDAFRDIKTLSLVDSASRRVASMILDGTLRPGDRLPPERELAARLGISRGALREALRSLEYVGLLQARVGSGRYVTHQRSTDPAGGISAWMQLQPIGEVIAIRRILEPAALATVPALCVDELAAEARRCYGQMAAAYSRGAYDTATRHHSAFHLVLSRYAPSELHRVLLASMIQVSSAAQLEIFRTGKAGIHSLQRHLPIVEALERGDVAEAAGEVALHLAPAFTYSEVVT
jgi:GntR family transcriptional regulator, transcriptional repressor for pyruvate dehydrogenase complex